MTIGPEKKLHFQKVSQMSNSTKKTASRIVSVGSRFGFELAVVWGFIAVFAIISRVDTTLEDLGFGLLELMFLAGVSMWSVHYLATTLREKFTSPGFDDSISNRLGPESVFARFIVVLVPLSLLSAISTSASFLVLKLLTSETGGFALTGENLTFLIILAVISSWLPSIAAVVFWNMMEGGDD